MSPIKIAQTIIAIRDAKVARMNLNAMMGRPLTDTVTLDSVETLDQIVDMSDPATG